MVRKRLWTEFHERREEWKISLRKWFASRSIQHVIKDRQKRMSSQSKNPNGILKRDSGVIPMQYEINLSEWSFFMTKK